MSINLENHKEFYHTSPGFNFTLSDAGDVLFINQKFRECLGYDLVEPLKINDILTSGSVIFFQVHLQPMIDLQHKADEVFLSFKTKTGNTVPVLLNAIRLVEGEIPKIHFAGINISQRNNYEKEILHARDVAEKALLDNLEHIRLKKELEYSQHQIEVQLQKIANYSEQHKQIDKVLSHDLQEPIRKISIFASLIENIDPEIEKNISKILKSSERLRKLLNRMQRLHAIENASLNLSNVSLKDIIEKAKNKLDIKDSSLQITHIDSLIFPADHDQLVNLFSELLDNSLKYKRNETPLVIKVTTDHFMQNTFIETEDKFQYGKYVRVTYSDNGSGFENTYAETVFELFSKLHMDKGLGFGLTLVKRIMSLHRGTVKLKSIENEGTTLTMLFPLEA
ncbi:PAS domain-containing sensor histidine kinase [Cellulophaga sp. E16_2]|uniref:histidine kinase n=1 Tax=Cellulophaga algicola (strain DSM 14237 / IC166 / ACAM 630) TaxID=688270 RepID=E6X8G7_CELAD|nr:MULTISPECIES: ATP-binding protein [Cellulophaga]ADV50823.1 PAS/PAC sensor signal transduction histidine kinase [Cellulophaga algicola DSM 14237]MBO0593219.1 PAS domain-containing sensor histidine kinase [Cellulophaga sp. E16_2]